jgi:hypothetical protein
MTKARESLISECKELLIRLERWIAADKFIRHQNGNIEVEYVLSSILNLVYGWQLNNANDLFGRSQDSFDLSDETNGIAVQVTVTDSAEKIRQTLKKFIGKHNHKFKRLVFAYPIISPAETRADFSGDLDGFDFDATRDRMGLGAILSAAQANQLLPLRNILRRELGTLASPSLEYPSTNVVIASTLIVKESIHMHVAGELRTRTDSPTLILSAYARPLPDNLPSVPRYPSPSWASGCEFTVLPLLYASKLVGQQISITPVNPYLTAIHNGGPIHTLNSADPWYDVFHFPTFDVKLVNNTDKTVFFHEAEFRVATSKPDYSAVPAVLGPLGSLYVRLANLGWGEMKNARLRFALTAVPEDQLDEAPLRLPEHLPHSIELGTFDSSKVFTLLPFFQIEGIDTNRVADLLDTEWDSDELIVKLRREFEFCYEAAAPEEEDRYVHANELPRADYESFLQKAAGRFYKSYPCMAGVLEYDETSREGSLMHRRVSVFAILDFRRYGFGAGAPPSNEYHVKLAVEQDDYVRKLQISQALKAGDVDRFLIQVAADRSSIHDLTFALRFNNDEVVEAEVHLELFCHPMAAHFASIREFSHP